MASRNAYDMHCIVYDLHRKFGSEMAAESSQKIDGENPSHSPGFAALRAPRPHRRGCRSVRHAAGLSSAADRLSIAGCRSRFLSFPLPSSVDFEGKVLHLNNTQQDVPPPYWGGLSL